MAVGAVKGGGGGSFVLLGSSSSSLCCCCCCSLEDDLVDDGTSLVCIALWMDGLVIGRMCMYVSRYCV